MSHLIDWFLKSYLFSAIVVILFFSLLIFVAIIVNRYVDDVFRLVLLIYIIYFPIGAFIGGYYLITTKEWFPRENDFTLCFLYNTSMMIILIAGKFLSGCVVRNQYKVKPSVKNSFWDYQFSRDYNDSKTELITFLAFYSNIFIGIYTLVGFCKLLVTWINLYLL